MSIRLVFFLLVSVLLVGVPLVAPAQFDSYPPPQGYGRQPGPPWPTVAPDWYLPYLQRSRENYPHLIRQWQQQRQWLDFQYLQRNPLNPEGFVDYMLRTF